MSDIKPDVRPEGLRQSELRIEFSKRVDGKGRTYYIAKPHLPIDIKLSNTALFFWMEDGPSMTVRFERDPKRDERNGAVGAGNGERPLMVDYDL